MNAVPGARTETTLPLSPPQSNMAPPSENNGKVKKDITKLPWRCAHHIRVIYTVNGMLLCLGYGCSSASPPPPLRERQAYYQKQPRHARDAILVACSCSKY